MSISWLTHLMYLIRSMLLSQESVSQFQHGPSLARTVLFGFAAQ